MQSINELLNFPYLDQDALVVFDIDYTILIPENKNFHFRNLQRYSALTTKIKEELGLKALDLLAMKHLTSSTMKVIEEEAIFQVFNKLRKDKIKHIGLTAAMPGIYDGHKLFEDLRFHCLKSFDLSFPLQQFSSNETQLIFDHFPPYHQRYPLYDRGILYSNGEGSPTHHKGSVLVSFLDHFQYRPKRILCVDDKVNNLNLLKQSLADYDSAIEFFGFHYLGHFDYPYEEVSAEEFESAWRELINF